jgi:hypothetical protein
MATGEPPGPLARPTDTAGGASGLPPTEGSAGPGSIRKALTSEAFIEKVAILLLTVILTGVLIPLIINHFSARAAERQKELEARKARDTSILQAQAKLLDDAADVILTYETLALDVSWYKYHEGANEEMHRKAFERYSERVPDLVARWRSLVSRSKTLASPAISDQLDGFLQTVFAEQDTPINALVGKKVSGSEWEKMHEKSRQMLKHANNLIEDLARDMRLSKADLHQ